jgi:hypothetical protein
MKTRAAATRALRQPVFITVVFFWSLHDPWPIIPRRFFADIGTIIAFLFKIH